MFRIYYHLYLGPSWRFVWGLHWPLLEEFSRSGRLDRLVICVYGECDSDLGICTSDRIEVRWISKSIHSVNEFHTLHELQKDVFDSSQCFDYCVYLHSKGSSSVVFDSSTVDWSKFLALALIESLSRFPLIVDLGFNCIGSNLALGLFEDFAGPRLHYSGNFWCATRQLIISTSKINLGSRHAAVRHAAEWWLFSASACVPFNVFSTGVNHYLSSKHSVDWKRLYARLNTLEIAARSPDNVLEGIRFMSGAIIKVGGRAGFRRLISKILLRSLPYQRWIRLFNAHDILMRKLGSRKSAYFYCTES